MPGVVGGPGPSRGSLAGVVDLDLLVDGGQHLPHPGLQPTQLGRFGIQHPLVPLVGLLQRCGDRGEKGQPGLPPPPPRPPPPDPLPRPHLAAAAACPGYLAAAWQPRPAAAVPGCPPAVRPAPGAPLAPALSGTGPAAAPPAPAGQWGRSVGPPRDPHQHPMPTAHPPAWPPRLGPAQHQPPPGHAWPPGCCWHASPSGRLSVRPGARSDPWHLPAAALHSLSGPASGNRYHGGRARSGCLHGRDGALPIPVRPRTCGRDSYRAEDSLAVLDVTCGTMQCLLCHALGLSGLLQCLPHCLGHVPHPLCP